MLSLRSRAFWIALPVALTAVSIFGVSRLHRQLAQTQTDVTTSNSTSTSTTPAPQPVPVTIPANTEIEVRLDKSISTYRADPGDSFFATVTDPVVVNGQTVIPQGAPVEGRVVSVHRAGRLKGIAELRLALISVEVDGNYYDLHSTTFARFGHNHKKRNWAFMGGGGGGGALLGALVGGGKGVLIGGPIGVGAGVAGAALTETGGKRNIVIPAETEMTFRIVQPVEVLL